MTSPITFKIFRTVTDTPWEGTYDELLRVNPDLSESVQFRLQHLTIEDSVGIRFDNPEAGTGYTMVIQRIK